MDLRRFIDLYLTETQEHMRLLQRSLIALEAGDASALDEAFRACHTLKSLSAAMGYAAPAGIAHGLEDRLDEVRAGRIVLNTHIMDGLLAEMDALEAAVTAASATPPVEPTAATSPAVSALAPQPAARPAVALPTGTVVTAQVRLNADAPLKSARAVLIMRALAALDDVLGSEPAAFEDDFGGTFFVFFGPAADTAAAERAIRAAGDIASIEIEEVGSTPAVLPPPRPPRQLRVDARRVDAIAEAAGEMSVLFAAIAGRAGALPGLTDTVGRLGVVLGALQHDVLALRMVPIRETFEMLPRVVRDAARTVGREIDLVLNGEDVELDRMILDEITEPLTHLLRNAASHGIETPAAREAAGKPARGRITVAAERERSSVCITVADDGGGIDAGRVIAKAKAAGLVAGPASDLDGMELLRLISNPGLSTADEVTAVSGRGVGMDVVVSRLRALGGAIQMETQAGAGTKFTMRLPLTMAVAQALRVRVGGEQYAIPLTHVTEAIELEGALLGSGAGEMLRVRGETMPLVRLRRMLRVEGSGTEEAAVIAELGGRRTALAVDELIGREQILIRSFDAVVGMLPYFSGATLLADGRPALVLDPLSVI